MFHTSQLTSPKAVEWYRSIARVLNWSWQCSVATSGLPKFVFCIIVMGFDRILKMRWLFFGVRRMSYNSSPGSASQKWNRNWFWIKKLKKKDLFQWFPCRKAIRGIFFANMWSADTQQRGLQFHDVKHQLKSGIFKCNASPGWMVCFMVVMIGVFWKRESYLFNDPNVASYI
jgi:hypothetical protein